jgi:hypothetical protein
VGTEFGLFVSLDGGERWMSWKHGIPAVPVRAIMVHPRDHDLVIATHGRGVFILDDIRPLRALASEPTLSAEAVHVFNPPPAYQVTIAERIGYRSTGHAMFFGENRPEGALISFWVGGDPDAADAQVTILDGAGEEIRSLRQAVDPGLNRIVWDLRSAGPGEEEGSFGQAGVPVLPGGYRVRVEVARESAEAALEIRPDPRTEVPLDRRRAKIEAIREVETWVALGAEARTRLEEAVEAVDGVLEEVGVGEDVELEEVGGTLKAALEEALETLFTGPSCQGICGGDPVASLIRQPLSILQSSVDAPSPNDRLAMARAEEALREVIGAVNALFEEDVAAYREMLRQAGYTPFPAREPLRMGGSG